MIERRFAELTKSLYCRPQRVMSPGRKVVGLGHLTEFRQGIVCDFRMHKLSKEFKEKR